MSLYKYCSFSELSHFMKYPRSFSSIIKYNEEDAVNIMATCGYTFSFMPDINFKYNYNDVNLITNGYNWHVDEKTLGKHTWIKDELQNGELLDYLKTQKPIASYHRFDLNVPDFKTYLENKHIDIKKYDSLFNDFQ